MNTLVVLTFKSVDALLENGGTGDWKLRRRNVERCEYAVCTRNRHDPRGIGGPEPHGAAFLVGKIADIVPAATQGRLLVRFSHYALLDVPNTWD